MTNEIKVNINPLKLFKYLDVLYNKEPYHDRIILCFFTKIDRKVEFFNTVLSADVCYQPHPLLSGERMFNFCFPKKNLLLYLFARLRREGGGQCKFSQD